MPSTHKTPAKGSSRVVEDADVGHVFPKEQLRQVIHHKINIRPSQRSRPGDDRSDVPPSRSNTSGLNPADHRSYNISSRGRFEEPKSHWSWSSQKSGKPSGTTAQPENSASGVPSSNLTIPPPPTPSKERAVPEGRGIKGPPGQSATAPGSKTSQRNDWEKSSTSQKDGSLQSSRNNVGPSNDTSNARLISRTNPSTNLNPISGASINTLMAPNSSQISSASLRNVPNSQSTSPRVPNGQSTSSRVPAPNTQTTTTVNPDGTVVTKTITKSWVIPDPKSISSATSNLTTKGYSNLSNMVDTRSRLLRWSNSARSMISKTSNTLGIPDTRSPSNNLSSRDNRRMDRRHSDSELSTSTVSSTYTTIPDSAPGSPDPNIPVNSENCDNSLRILYILLAIAYIWLAILTYFRCWRSVPVPANANVTSTLETDCIDNPSETGNEDYFGIHDDCSSAES